MSDLIKKLTTLGLLVVAIFFLLKNPALARFGETDFLQYWAGGQIFLNEGNPYDAKLIEQVEKSVSDNPAIPVLLWNPPIVLPLIAPFSLLQFAYAKTAWLLLTLIIIAFGVISSLRLFADNASYQTNFLLLTFCLTFYPIASNLQYGQISHLLLLGLVCFLIFVKSKANEVTNSTYAGLCLSLTLIKPHLLALLYLLLFLRSIYDRRYKLILGFLCGGIFLASLAIILNKQIFNYYFAQGLSFPIYWKTPTIGSWLQGAFDIHSIWLRTLPLIVGLLITSAITLAKSNFRNSASFILTLIPASLALSPYGWIYDQLLLIPSSLFIISRSRRLAIILLLANIAVAIPWHEHMGQESAVWYPPLVATFCMIAMRKEFATSDPTQLTRLQ